MSPLWLNNFKQFLTDLGPRPVGTTLHRIDGTKGYEPGNCEWATAAKQAAHRKSTRWIDFEGERLPAAVYAAKNGMTPAAIYKRLQKGKDVYARKQNKGPRKAVA
jgi:hypothetical protein